MHTDHDVFIHRTVLVSIENVLQYFFKPQCNIQLPPQERTKPRPEFVHFSGRDVIGLAETGSGKTGAFGLPILQVYNFPAYHAHKQTCRPTSIETDA